MESATGLIKRRREGLGLSLQELAEKVGVSKSYLSRIESGERSLNDGQAMNENIYASASPTSRYCSGWIFRRLISSNSTKPTKVSSTNRMPYLLARSAWV